MALVKPNLFIPGAGKSGTSSLHQYLNLHPDIYMSKKKEPHFFAYDYKYFDDSEGYYESFDQGKSSKYRGESSTGYMVFPDVIERIKKDIVNPKFIFVLRNPIDRIFSHYNWVDGIVGENLSFENAIKKDFHKEPKAEDGFSWGYKNYFQFGLYSKWLERFYNNFNTNDILIILTEDLKRNPLETLNSCCRFLDIPEFNEVPIIESNKSIVYKNATLYHKIIKLSKAPKLFNYMDKYLPSYLFKIIINLRHKIYLVFKRSLMSNKPKSLTIKQRLWLKELYLEDFIKLQKLTNIDFKLWKDFNGI